MQTGVMLTQVEPEMRTLANSLANVSYNLLGYFPAPIIYGFACKIDDDPKSSDGMKVLMLATIFMTIFIGVSIVFIKRDKK